MPIEHYFDSVSSYFSALDPTEAFHNVHCIFCGPDAETALLFEKGSMKVVRCQCGLVYNARQPTQEVLSAFYETSKAMEKWAELKSGVVEKFRQLEKYSWALSALWCEPPKTLLDIGCGNGYFLSKLSANTIGIGIETSPSAIARAKEAGLDVREGEVLSLFSDQSTIGNLTFDAISMWGVLEHLPFPLYSLRLAANRINPGGRLIVCVPNVDSLVVSTLWSECSTFCPQHLWYFNEDTLKRAIAKVGLEWECAITIEPELMPTKRRISGYPPYQKQSSTFEPSVKMFEEESILNAGKGYKIVAIARKPK